MVRGRGAQESVRRHGVSHECHGGQGFEARRGYYFGPVCQGDPGLEGLNTGMTVATAAGESPATSTSLWAGKVLLPCLSLFFLEDVKMFMGQAHVLKRTTLEIFSVDL